MRSFRILLDDNAGEGGGGANPAPTPTPTPSPAPTETVTNVTVSAEEYKRLLESQSKLAEADAQREREAKDAEQRVIDALAKKGESDAALAKQRELSDAELKKARDRGDALEAQILSDRKSAAITNALLGVEFVSPAAAAQARDILDNLTEAVRDAAGVVTIREKSTHKAAVAMVKDWLASPDSAHFRKASTAGGAGANGGDKPAPTGGADKPMTVSEALIAHSKAQLANPDRSYYGLTRGGSVS